MFSTIIRNHRPTQRENLVFDPLTVGYPIEVAVIQSEKSNNFMIRRYPTIYPPLAPPKSETEGGINSTLAKSLENIQIF